MVSAFLSVCFWCRAVPRDLAIAGRPATTEKVESGNRVTHGAIDRKFDTSGR
jgi:hypothetical protein